MCVRLILASVSPRRADLLRAAGFTFDVVPVEIDERPLTVEPPRDYVCRLAVAKAAEIARRNSDRPVLAADTTVVVDDLILAKPGDESEATKMLRMLSGGVHEVLTGVALQLGERRVHAVACTQVHFLQMSPAEIAWYVASGEPYDKAGGYAVQGLASRFVERIDGSYSNVVGLPVATVYRLLKDFGLV